jgi:hypothetical protein
VERSVSKSKFKPRLLEFFREIELTGEPLIIMFNAQCLMLNGGWEKSNYELRTLTSGG